MKDYSYTFIEACYNKTPIEFSLTLEEILADYSRDLANIISEVRHRHSIGGHMPLGTRECQ